jgi:hypothetical protein
VWGPEFKPQCQKKKTPKTGEKEGKTDAVWELVVVRDDGNKEKV